jgi:hypothetical protein
MTLGACREYEAGGGRVGGRVGGHSGYGSVERRMAFGEGFGGMKEGIAKLRQGKVDGRSGRRRSCSRVSRTTDLPRRSARVAGVWPTSWACSASQRASWAARSASRSAALRLVGKVVFCAALVRYSSCVKLQHAHARMCSRRPCPTPSPSRR